MQSIINRFEGISVSTTSSSLTPPQNTKPKLLPKPLSISGIKHPYSEPFSNVEPKISDAGARGVQSPSTKPKVRFSSKVKVRIFDPNKQIIYTRPKIEPSTKPITRPTVEQSTRTSTKPTKSQFNLKITNSPSPNHKPINISEKRMKNLEALVKVNVAAIVKENLPENFTANGPIPIKFDQTSGQELSAALSRFIYVTTQNILKSLSQKQD